MNASDYLKKHKAHMPSDHSTFSELVKKFDKALSDLGFKGRVPAGLAANFTAALNNLRVHYDRNKVNDLRTCIARILTIKYAIDL